MSSKFGWGRRKLGFSALRSCRTTLTSGKNCLSSGGFPCSWFVNSALNSLDSNIQTRRSSDDCSQTLVCLQMRTAGLLICIWAAHCQGELHVCCWNLPLSQTVMFSAFSGIWDEFNRIRFLCSQRCLTAFCAALLLSTEQRNRARSPSIPPSHSKRLSTPIKCAEFSWSPELRSIPPRLVKRATTESELWVEFNNEDFKTGFFCHHFRDEMFHTLNRGVERRSVTPAGGGGDEDHTQPLGSWSCVQTNEHKENNLSGRIDWRLQFFAQVLSYLAAAQWQIAKGLFSWNWIGPQGTQKSEPFALLSEITSIVFPSAVMSTWSQCTAFVVTMGSRTIWNPKPVVIIFFVWHENGYKSARNTRRIGSSPEWRFKGLDSVTQAAIERFLTRFIGGRHILSATWWGCVSSFLKSGFLRGPLSWIVGSNNFDGFPKRESQKWMGTRENCQNIWLSQEGTRVKNNTSNCMLLAAQQTSHPTKERHKNPSLKKSNGIQNGS